MRGDVNGGAARKEAEGEGKGERKGRGKGETAEVTEGDEGRQRGGG